MGEYTDIELISQYLAGNHKSFDGLVMRYTQIIYRFSLKLVGNKDEAHDITQETIIKAWKNIKRFDKRRNFKTWIFTIAQRTAIDFLRKRKNVNFSTLDTESVENSFEQNIPDKELLPDEIFEKNENIDLVQKVLETISIENKIIVLLKNGEEMTFDEIAEIVGKPLNTVKSQYRRTLILLKKKLGENMHQNIS